MINFIRAIPTSLKEAARIDGANEMFVFTRIVLPLSKPIIATLSLFVAVTRWNSFFSAIIYIRDQGLWTLQLLLREILFSTENFLDDTSSMNLPVQGMKYAVIIVAVVPILCVYPFIQKYFAKGIMLGAVKG
jgi:putative aldouronate transport system permease protein